MPTDTETAAAWRTLADGADEQGLHRLAIERRKIADTIDPPKPKYPEGTIAWVSGIPRRCIAVRHDGAWRISMDGTGGVVVRHDENVTKVEPLRVLGYDEIAVKRVDAHSGELRDVAGCHAFDHDPLPRLSSKARLILDHYADALDAEAGDRS